MIEIVPETTPEIMWTGLFCNSAVVESVDVVWKDVGVLLLHDDGTVASDRHETFGVSSWTAAGNTSA